MADEVLTKSVTKADQNPGTTGNGFGWGNYLTALVPSYISGQVLPVLPPYYSPVRDQLLSATVLYEGNWASAVSIAITMMASHSWSVKAVKDNEIPQVVARYQELFHATNVGKGWVHFLSQHLRDFLCTDNGAFIEVVRATQGQGSRILGLVHLDSRRCQRTGNPDVPVQYRDRLGALHELKAHQVISLVDMADPGLTWNGVGLCAASRAYRAIRKMTLIDQFLEEKIGGFRPNGITFVNGISGQQVKQALMDSEQQAQQKGAVVYRGRTIVPMMDDKAPTKVEVEFASLPDGFVYKDELSIALQRYANAIGLDPQDLQPLTGQALGTGAQSQVLDQKAQGRGLAAWMQAMTHLLNEYVLDDRVVFAFSERDLRDDMQKAQVTNARATAVGAMTQSGVLTPAEGKEYLVDIGELDDKYLPSDVTPNLILTDDQKPEGQDTNLDNPSTDAINAVNAVQGQPTQPAKPQAGSGQPAVPALTTPATKEYDPWQMVEIRWQGPEAQAQYNRLLELATSGAN